MFGSAIELGYHSSKLCLLSLVWKNKFPENFILQKFFLQERRVDFFERCFAVSRKFSRGPQKDRGPQFENHWFRRSLNGKTGQTLKLHSYGTSKQGGHITTIWWCSHLRRRR